MDVHLSVDNPDSIVNSATTGVSKVMAACDRFIELCQGAVSRYMKDRSGSRVKRIQ